MIYCVAIAGIWQTSGFVMAMFLAGLRGVDGEILKAAQIDGASAYADLSAHRHSDHAAGVPLGADHPRPHGDQVLRPRALGHRQESRRRRRAAVDLHVFLHLHPQPDGGRLDERGDHADDDRRDHGALPLFRDSGRRANDRRRPPRLGAGREPTRHSTDDPRRHLRPARRLRRHLSRSRSSSW